MGQDWRICRLGACHALFFERNLDRPRPAHSSASKPGTEQCPAGKTQIHRTQPADLRLGTRETRQSQPDAELLGQGGGSPAWQSDSTPMLHSKGGEHNRGTAGSSAGNFVHQVWWTRDPVLASRCDRREMLLEFGSILSAIYHVTAPACRHSRHADSSVCCTKKNSAWSYCNASCQGERRSERCNLSDMDDGTSRKKQVGIPMPPQEDALVHRLIKAAKYSPTSACLRTVYARPNQLIPIQRDGTVERCPPRKEG